MNSRLRFVVVFILMTLAVSTVGADYELRAYEGGTPRCSVSIVWMLNPFGLAATEGSAVDRSMPSRSAFENLRESALLDSRIDSAQLARIERLTYGMARQALLRFFAEERPIFAIDAFVSEWFWILHAFKLGGFEASTAVRIALLADHAFGIW